MGSGEWRGYPAPTGVEGGKLGESGVGNLKFPTPHSLLPTP